MSRIGKRILQIPEGVQINVNQRDVKVIGPKGELNVRLPLGIVVQVKENTVSTKLADETKAKLLSPMWGLANSLINNALIGVKEGFSKRLELHGVGYRAKITDRKLSMTLGFSHPTEYLIPQGVNVNVEDNTKILVSGVDKELVGLVCSQIRKFKKPEPYKGKGIRYSDEVVRRKPGKAGKAQK